jgi:hypothetical protein
LSVACDIWVCPILTSNLTQSPKPFYAQATPVSRLVVLQIVLVVLQIVLVVLILATSISLCRLPLRNVTKTSLLDGAVPRHFPPPVLYSTLLNCICLDRINCILPSWIAFV